MRRSLVALILAAAGAATPAPTRGGGTTWPAIKWRGGTPSLRAPRGGASGPVRPGSARRPSRPPPSRACPGTSTAWAGQLETSQALASEPPPAAPGRSRLAFTFSFQCVNPGAGDPAEDPGQEAPLGASRLVVGCSLLLVTSSLFANDAATARAAEPWALARAARGGSALDAVQSLSATGAFRRTLPRRSPGRARRLHPGPHSTVDRRPADRLAVAEPVQAPQGQYLARWKRLRLRPRDRRRRGLDDAPGRPAASRFPRDAAA